MSKAKSSDAVKPKRRLTRSGKSRPGVAVKPKGGVADSNGKGANRPLQPITTMPQANGAKRKAKLPVQSTPRLPSLCAELMALEKLRSQVMKSRIMNANRLQSLVAGTTLGFRTDMEDAARKKVFKEASILIKQIVAGETAPPITPLVLVHEAAISAFEQQEKVTEKKMVGFAKLLPRPVVDWVLHEDQRGFGLLFLAIVIGETGDLSNYPGPSYLWKRLGCAPITYDGKTLMPSTWRSGKYGKLPAEVWAREGYNPRRRSSAYLIGVGLLKQNGKDSEKVLAKKKLTGATPKLIDGPYRISYEEAKRLAGEKHPDWICCPQCKGAGGKCSSCKGTGEVWKRCHMHGMLISTKFLLKNLWIVWNGYPAKGTL